MQVYRFNFMNSVQLRSVEFNHLLKDMNEY